jgi:hypothetical protein
MITGQESWYMDNFKLPDHDTQEVRRNFPGYEVETYLTLEDLKQGDHHQERGGMTETDEDTSGQNDGPYTKLQEKTKGQKSRWPNKQSGKGKRYNSEKSTGFGKLKF